ncbi:MAG: TIR domain-containing protein [Chloroflexi bacterium]|jgi:hypothetical protein|nr:TIR domain-containing protein [Chloroflexota bacterium]
MSHIVLTCAQAEQTFAQQLAVQLQQRGLIVWPVLDEADASSIPFDSEQALEGASHVLIILSPASMASDTLLEQCTRALSLNRPAILLVREPIPIPERLHGLPQVNFHGRFLLAIEELVELLRESGAPTRPLTIEHPPPVFKEQLLPATLPAERCWREDRLRVHYELPIILPDDELAIRLPAFWQVMDFEPLDSDPGQFRAQRRRRFGLFDPRRAEHTLTIVLEDGSLSAFYQMTRLQVYYWFPAHYQVLNREAAALYRYLATGTLAEIREPINRQARVAQVVVIAAIIIALLVITGLVLLLLDEFLGVSPF